jgi:hypothetical protein
LDLEVESPVDLVPQVVGLFVLQVIAEVLVGSGGLQKRLDVVEIERRWS